MLDLSLLNRKQREAVRHGQGPLLIAAGAGTGKTTVVASRVAYLIEKGLAKPEEILAVTFTDKASQEMLDRVDQLLSRSYVDLWISTFHSFGDRVLREHGLDIGLGLDFKLLDQTAAWLLIRQNFDRFKLDYYRPLASPTKFLRALLEHFSRLKDQAVSPSDYLKYAKTQKGEEGQRLKEVAAAFQTYQNLLLENGFLDFGDLINYCLELFQKRSKILEKYRQQFKYILVDEFQDTNWSQYQLVKLLAAPRNNLTVCADSRQAIYRWRGASWGNLLQFERDFPQAKKVVLEENYRSFQEILDLAHRFIKDEGGPKLQAAKKGQAEISHFHFKTSDQEVSGVVKKIVEILKNDKTATFNDFAILVRANLQAAPFARALERSGIPYQFLALKGLYAKPIILDVIAYFKFLDDYHESSSGFRLLRLPCWQIDDQDIARITHYSFRKSQSIFETLQELHLVEGLSEKTRLTAGRLLNLVSRHTRLAQEKNVSEILLSFLEDSGYLPWLVKKERKAEIDFVSQFHQRIKSFEETHLDARLQPFMEELKLELESGEEGKLNFDLEQGPEVVKIMTVHSAKGLEFRHVFLVNLVDKRFPTIERGDPIEIPAVLIKETLSQGDYHLEEERRLFYVALTRAKQGLFLCSAEDYGGVQTKRPSRFLSELGFKSEALPSKNGTTRLTINGGSRRQKIREKGLVLPERFSFTQLIAFLKCPLQYKFAHVLKIPIKGRPAFSFGKTMHNTLHQFLLAPSDFKKLLAIYEKEWLDDWYESKKQKQEYFELGQQTLEKFYDGFVRDKPHIFSPGGKPALEQDFNLKIGGHTLIGKIDRIDDLGQGQVEIIDYKTGSAKEKLRPEDKKQLLIYQIAAEEVLGLKPKKLTYYYLDEGASLSFLGNPDEIAKEKREIVREIEEIKTSDFKATPGWQCDWCDFKDICEFAKINNH
jgi:DNA helicase-2/ATP-dependent DNA helicase PcrA